MKKEVEDEKANSVYVTLTVGPVVKNFSLCR